MRAKEQRLPAEVARQLLSYDPATGLLTWLPREGSPAFNTKYAGQPAGNVRKNGKVYAGVTIDGQTRLYANHRLAWLLYHGEWPAKDIDHINRNPTDNRIANLRLATHAQNLANQSMRRDNTSGCRGVFWIERSKRWVALISQYNGGNQRNIYLGSFTDKAEAIRVRQEAARRLFGEFANETPVDLSAA